jgi:hypothetical protein
LTTKKEVFQLLEDIKAIWDNFDVTQKKLDLWHEVLKETDFAIVQGNFMNYLKAGNEFAPKPGQLIKKENRDRYIPSHEETKQYLDNLDKITNEVANNPKVSEARDKALADIRKMLGIKQN